MAAGAAACAAVGACVARLPTVGLTAVLEGAALHTRLERKYLVPIDRFGDLIAVLAERFGVLEIGRRRVFAYESVYFDTPAMLTYRQHLQGRRRRYKVRTRAYLDSDVCAFEVKLHGNRGQTVKERLPYPLAHRACLTPAAKAFLAGHLRRYGVAVPVMGPVVTMAYHRTTLVDLDEGVRLTCDVELNCRGAGTGVEGLHRHVLVETKNSRPDGHADRALRRLGLRPVQVSKYCLAVALLHPEVRANPWQRTMRRYFDTAPAYLHPPCEQGAMGAAGRTRAAADRRDHPSHISDTSSGARLDWSAGLPTCLRFRSSQNRLRLDA